MTYSARNRVSVEQQLKEQVNLWLQINHSKMQRHQAAINEYKSENLSVTVDGAVGPCYVVYENRKNNSDALSTVAYSLQLIEILLDSRI